MPTITQYLRPAARRASRVPIALLSSSTGIPALAVALALGLALGMSSCATVPEGIHYADPAGFMTRDAEIYLRVSGRTSRDLVESLGKERIDRIAYAAMKPAPSIRPEEFHVNQASLDQFLTRMSAAGVGISYEKGGRPVIEAAILGNYAGSSLPMALAMNGDWEKGPSGYAHRSGELYMANPQPGILKFGTDRGRTRLPSSGEAPEMLPARYAAYGQRPAGAGSAGSAAASASTQPDLRVWIGNPGRHLGGAAFGEPLTLPVEGIFISATRQTADSYVADIILQAKDEAQARTFRPVIRFLWAAAADRIFGSGTSSLYALNQEGDSYRVRNMVVSLPALVQLIPLP